MATIENLGYLQYSGKLVDDGYMDARKSAEALIGFDEVLRYFIVKAHPELKDVPIDIPVKVQIGSWVALVGVGVGIVATSYLSSAANTLAKNDFKNLNSKDLFKRSLRKLQDVMRLAIHLKGFTRTVTPKFKQNNTVVSIVNTSGQSLDVPTEHLQLYLQANPKMFTKIAKIIEEERVLKIGVIDQNNNEEIEISHTYKYIFAEDEDPSDIILPELEHGKKVELVGEIPKGNERSNSIGLFYNGYTLSCVPAKGSIVTYKNALFSTCKIKGTVDRAYNTGEPIEKKPRIIFDEITPIDNGAKEIGLFD